MSKIKIKYIKDLSSLRIQVSSEIYQSFCNALTKHKVEFIDKDESQGQQIGLENNEIQARTYPMLWDVLKEFSHANPDLGVEIALQSEHQEELQSLLEKHMNVVSSSPTMSRDSAASTLAKKAKAPCCCLFGFFFAGAITKSVSGAAIGGALLGTMFGGPDDSEQHATKKFN